MRRLNLINISLITAIFFFYGCGDVERIRSVTKTVKNLNKKVHKIKSKTDKEIKSLKEENLRLAEKVKQMEDMNNKLKKDLHFFQIYKKSHVQRIKNILYMYEVDAEKAEEFLTVKPKESKPADKVDPN